MSQQQALKLSPDSIEKLKFVATDQRSAVAKRLLEYKSELFAGGGGVSARYTYGEAERLAECFSPLSSAAWAIYRSEFPSITPMQGASRILRLIAGRYLYIGGFNFEGIEKDDSVKAEICRTLEAQTVEDELADARRSRGEATATRTRLRLFLREAKRIAGCEIHQRVFYEATGRKDRTQLQDFLSEDPNADDQAKEDFERILRAGPEEFVKLIREMEASGRLEIIKRPRST